MLHLTFRCVSSSSSSALLQYVELVRAAVFSVLSCTCRGPEWELPSLGEGTTVAHVVEEIYEQVQQTYEV